ncbi:MAG: hypothetical protein ACK5TR_07265 [Alphaproteobacteria bacterium]|jgi:hypothetical protein|nr:hypothetical protein [Alphaproteobacteria bacterium]
MVKNLALYTALSLMKSRFFKGLLGMILFLCAVSFFFGSTLLLEGEEASQHFYDFILIPCLFFTLGQSVISLLFRMRDTQEEDFFVGHGLLPFSYGVGIFAGYASILFLLCAVVFLPHLMLFNAPMLTALQGGASLFLQAVGVLWLAVLLGFSSRYQAQGTLCLGLVLMMSFLKQGLLTTGTSAWITSSKWQESFWSVLQKLSLLLPPFTLDLLAFSWKDALQTGALLGAFTLLTFTRSWYKVGVFSLTAFWVVSAPFTPPAERRPRQSIPYDPPSLIQREFLKGLNSSFFGYVALLYLHHAGDMGNARLPLRLYSYEKVIGWLQTADSLVPSSDLPPFLGTFYFGMTPDPEQRALLVSYLTHYTKNHPHKSWWLTFATRLEQQAR